MKEQIMTRKRWLLGGAVILLIIAAPIGWWLISPLFINVSVEEDFPAAQAAAAMTESDEMMDESMTADAEMMDAAPMATAESEMMTQDMATATAEPEMMTQAPTATPRPAPTSTPAPTPTPAEPIALKSGEFHAVEHEGTGTATIYQLPDGTHILRFENLDVLNGPDLFVWLSAAPDANDSRTILDNQYVELGRLKGNQGSQNYEIPADIDISQFNSVSIWCRAFRVNFATAPLN
jgi:hypothetical protein